MSAKRGLTLPWCVLTPERTEDAHNCSFKEYNPGFLNLSEPLQYLRGDAGCESGPWKHECFVITESFKIELVKSVHTWTRDVSYSVWEPGVDRTLHVKWATFWKEENILVASLVGQTLQLAGRTPTKSEHAKEEIDFRTNRPRGETGLVAVPYCWLRLDYAYIYLK